MTEAIEKPISARDKERWILDNMPLVGFFARRYAKAGEIDFEELRGMAGLALVIGAEQKFDPRRQVRCKDSTLVSRRLVDEIRRELSARGITRRINGRTGRSFVSLIEPVDGDDTDLRWEECIPDDNAKNPQEAAIKTETVDRLNKVLSCLNKRERWIIKRSYWDGLTHDQIAIELNVSPPRISQLHRQALLKLRKQLE